MKKFISLLILIMTARFASAKPVEIMLASFAPEATPWGKALNKMAAEWKSASNGQVILKVFHNGVMGNDERVLMQKLRGNSIQGAVFTSIGLNLINKKIFTLSSPFLVQSNAELDYVLSSMGGEFESMVEEGGFQLAAWSRVGWIRFFARHPVLVPADLKKQRLIGTLEMPELTNLFKMQGYTVIPTNFNDVMVALSSNKVDAVFQIPPYVAALQTFGIAKYMLPVDIAPVMGGIVLNRKIWREIPDQYKPKLLQIAHRIAAENDRDALKMSDDAIATMARYGLQTTSPTEAQRQMWVDEAVAAIPAILNARNPVVDAEMYKRIDDLLKKYRAEH